MCMNWINCMSQIKFTRTCSNPTFASSTAIPPPGCRQLRPWGLTCDHVLLILAHRFASQPLSRRLPVAHGSNEWGAPCPPTDNADTKSLQMPPHIVGIPILSCVVGSRSILQPDRFSLHLVLKPKIANVEVAQLAKSCTSDYAHCNAGVIVHRDRYRGTEIFK